MRRRGMDVWCFVQGLNNYRGWRGRVCVCVCVCGYRAIFEIALPFSSTCTLSADPQLLCIFSWLLLALLVATPRNWLNASVVRFTRTFSEPIRRKPRSFSACSTNHRVTALQSSSRAHSLRSFFFSFFW